jgi:hypothetical protein
MTSARAEPAGRPKRVHPRRPTFARAGEAESKTVAAVEQASAENSDSAPQGGDNNRKEPNQMGDSQ